MTYTNSTVPLLLESKFNPSLEPPETDNLQVNSTDCPILKSNFLFGSTVSMGFELRIK